MNRTVQTIINSVQNTLNAWRDGLKQPKNMPDSNSGHRLLVLIVMSVFGFVILRNGWVSDDAHIILRTLDNFAGGYGLRWNVGERVQTYTCPLWTLLLAPFHWLAGEGFYTTIAISTVIALATVYFLIFRIPQHPFTSIWVFVMLISSRGFIDFSTSGLENSLGHLLIVLYFIQSTRAYRQEAIDRHFMRHFIGASILLCLIVLNRMDTLLLLLPLQVLLIFKKADFKQVVHRSLLTALCFTPFVLWELFSLFYYGFLFPNTAYAKLNSGISSYVLFIQGLSYLRNCLDWDPLTALTIVVALFSGIVFRPRRHPIRVALSIGILLSLIYVARVGGDHMSVRFLTPAFFASVLSLTTWRFFGTHKEKAIIAIFAVVGLTGVGIPIMTNSQEQPRPLDSAGIVDDRNFAARWFSIFSGSPSKPMVANYLGYHGNTHRRVGKHVIVTGHIGLLGCNVGPDVSIIDVLGLADPLTARLSFGFGEWRPAHFARQVPGGYPEAMDGTGQIHDPDLRAYYRHLKTIISGDLWDMRRLKEIYRFNTGAYDHLKDRYEMRATSIKPYKQVSGFKRNTPGIPWNDKDNTLMGRAGLGIRIPNHILAKVGYETIPFSVSLSGGEIYDMFLLNRGSVIDTQTLDLSDAQSGYLTTIEKTFHSKKGAARVDLIRFSPKGSFGKFAIGHFRIEGPPVSISLDTLKPGGKGYTFADRDVDISLGSIRYNRTVRLSLPQESAFRIEFYNVDSTVWKTEVLRNGFHRYKTEEKTIYLPPGTFEKGYDRIRIVPVVGPPGSRFGFLTLR